MKRSQKPDASLPITQTGPLLLATALEKATEIPLKIAAARLRGRTDHLNHSKVSVAGSAI